MNLASVITKKSSKTRLYVNRNLEAFNADLYSNMLNDLVSRITDDTQLVLLSEEVTYPDDMEGTSIERTQFTARPAPVMPTEFRGLQPGVLYDFRNGGRSL